MKQHFQKHLLLLAAALLLPAAGCKKDFLDIKPQGELTTENFFQTSDQAVWATNACYASLREWDVHILGYLGMTDIVSDDAVKGSIPNDAPDLADFENFTASPSHERMLGVWRGYYRAIFRTNQAIEGIPTVPEMDATLRARLIAECKFLRAVYYFNLVRWWGDVPLILRALNPDEFQQARSPKAEVYNQIVKDLTEAAAVLPAKSKYPASDLGRATSGAALGYLAKVCLTVGDFANAEKYALQVINSGEYSLVPKYRDIFRPEGENGAESIFEVQCIAYPSQDHPFYGSCQYSQVQMVRGIPNLGWGFNGPSKQLRGEYESGDPRLDATILDVGETLPDGSTTVKDNPDMFEESYNQKAWSPQHQGYQENGPVNIRLLRYADVLLIAAEALNENGHAADALPHLNLVRKRAKDSSPNPFLNLPPVTATDKMLLREKIWHERRVELGMEQHRWFDLVRTGRAAATMQALGKNFEAGKHELFPIPQSEIDLSGGLMVQNPGYF